MNQIPVGQTPYGSTPPYYAIAHEEKRRLRSACNQVCWTALLGILGMGLFTSLFSYYARVLGIPYNPAYADFKGFPPVLFYLLVGAEYSLGLALPALLFFVLKKIPLDEGLPFQKADVWKVAAYVFFGVMVCMLANYPANMVSVVEKYFGFSGQLAESPLTDDWRVLVLYGIDIMVIPPLVEEMMFRGVVLQSLRRYGNGFAIVASALLFGLYHGNFIQMAFAFFCGLVMGLAVVRTNSLLPSILIHFINNGVSYALEMILRYRGENVENTVSNFILMVSVALGLIALIVLAVQRRRSPVPKERTVLPLSSKMAALFTNVGGMAFLAFGIISSVYDLVKG